VYGERNGFAVRKLNDLQAIEPMGYNSDGRPNRYRIIEPGGAWYQLSAEELRLACNTSVGGSPLATTKGVPVGNPLAANAPAAENSLALVQSPPGQALPEITRQIRVNSGDFEVVVRGDRVIFSGRGFGHGVGLCQYCAKAFAERGEDWRTIIGRFYPGARIVDLY
jgi:SpoIID/LytB domain protein